MKRFLICLILLIIPAGCSSYNAVSRVRYDSVIEALWKDHTRCTKYECHNAYGLLHECDKVDMQLYAERYAERLAWDRAIEQAWGAALSKTSKWDHVYCTDDRCLEHLMGHNSCRQKHP